MSEAVTHFPLACLLQRSQNWTKLPAINDFSNTDEVPPGLLVQRGWYHTDSIPAILKPPTQDLSGVQHIYTPTFFRLDERNCLLLLPNLAVSANGLRCDIQGSPLSFGRIRELNHHDLHNDKGKNWLSNGSQTLDVAPCTGAWVEQNLFTKTQQWSNKTRLGLEKVGCIIVEKNLPSTKTSCERFWENIYMLRLQKETNTKSAHQYWHFIVSLNEK